MTTACAKFDAAIAALGTPAIEPDEEAGVRAHLAQCARCAEVARLLNSDSGDNPSSIAEVAPRSIRGPGRGSVIAGRYRLERMLGRGGMGVVWAAVQEPTGQPVAIKLLHGDLPDARSRRRAIREARAACAVRHPNVVRVLDLVETSEGSPALVMESLEGHTLERRFEKGPLAVGQVCAVLGAVAAAVEAAHAAAVVHRDLKPDNVFLARASSSIDVKVLDFGVAKITRRGHEPAATLTRTGAMVGTPFYMAPEQVLGEADVDARADLWALGLMLYQGLTGVLPTRGDNLGQVIKAVTITPFPPIARVAPHVPSDLAGLIDTMLAKDRDERARDLREIRAVLARHADASVDPRPDLDDPDSTEAPPPERSWERIAPRRGRALGVGVGIVVALATVAGLGLVATRPAVETAAASPPAGSVAASATLDPAPAVRPPSTATPAVSASAPAATPPLDGVRSRLVRTPRSSATTTATAAPQASAIGVEREF